MALCINRNRKTAHAGGGTAGCRGRLIIRINVPVSVPVKRIPRGGDGAAELLSHRVRTHATKIRPEKIIRLVDKRKYDVVCEDCGWSLDAAIANMIKAQKARMKR